MARLPRISIANIPQHIIQRGNNRQACFASNNDLSAYAEWLREAAAANGVSIHAWVFMTNHVHLLATPQETASIAKMMQTLGRHYVRYFNDCYQRTGTLWEGRYKSCLVQSETYVLTCARYIELNPVRAGMVNDPADYPWSSYACHAFGKPARMWTPHEVYLGLAQDAAGRQRNYRELFRQTVGGRLLDEIRDSVNKGLVMGTEPFKGEIELRLKRRVRPAKMGRPKKRGAESLL